LIAYSVDCAKILGDEGGEPAAPTEKTPIKEEKKSYHKEEIEFPQPKHSVGIPREVFGYFYFDSYCIFSAENEARVAATPESVIWLRKMAFSVFIEKGAGLKARFTDDVYIQAGATIVQTTRELYDTVEVVLKVRPPQEHPGNIYYLLLFLFYFFF
jgi:hypothetical protein